LQRKLLAVVLLFFVTLAALAVSSGSLAVAQEGAHASAGTIVLDDLSVEERQRARSLWSHVICSCPRENWSKTLANCPDGCSDPQKQVILRQVREDWSDESIFEYQVGQWGTKVLAKPDDFFLYALPVAFLLGCIMVVWVVLRNWRRQAAAAHAAHHLGVPADVGELAAVERELEELR
jgi:cytochrome c-type biogenesis protein CcmH/NrfF